METKKCTKCSIEQDIENFYIRRTRNNQRKSICKECESKQKAKKVIQVPDLEGEIWKDVIDYEGVYLVSNFARVKRIMSRKNPTCDIMNNIYHPSGYVHISLTNNGKGRNFKLHRLVAMAFIPNPENKPQVNHIDGNKLNNLPSNLEWNTSKENINHAWNTGLSKPKNGEKSNFSKLTEKEILEIRELGITVSPKEISVIYNVSVSYIRRVINRKRWVHI